MNSGPLEQAKAEAPGALGLYVHVPFCSSTCDFCAFYQVKPTGSDVGRFLAGIAAEARLAAIDRPIETVFWGGGTPGLLSPADLGKLGAIVNRLSLVEPRLSLEWSVELAPASVTAERLAVLRDIGVNRLSLGVQSFSPDWLDALGRLHTREQVYRAYDRIRAAGFANVNLDLMFALPGQTEADWESDLREAVRLGPEHLSTYCLTFEEDTAMWVKLSQGKIKLDVEREIALYERTWEWLGEAGFAQYEISNFAQPGRECRHNVNTWAMHEWVGLGPSAASQHRGRRSKNIADLAQWLEGVAAGERATEDAVTLSPALLAEDALIFGLRQNRGVALAGWRARAPEAPWAEWDERLGRLAAEGLLERRGDVVWLTHRGRLLADRIGSELMAV
jgi:oxygen-independent coproporphyrinogen-3 oxidase